MYKFPSSRSSVFQYRGSLLNNTPSHYRGSIPVLISSRIAMLYFYVEKAVLLGKYTYKFFMFFCCKSLKGIQLFNFSGQPRHSTSALIRFSYNARNGEDVWSFNPLQLFFIKYTLQCFTAQISADVDVWSSTQTQFYDEMFFRPPLNVSFRKHTFITTDMYVISNGKFKGFAIHS